MTEHVNGGIFVHRSAGPLSRGIYPGDLRIPAHEQIIRIVRTVIPHQNIPAVQEVIHRAPM